VPPRRRRYTFALGSLVSHVHLFGRHFFSAPMERILKTKLKGGRFEDVSETRSRIMSSIRGKRNRTTELALRLALVRSHVRGWRLHPSDVLGHPDFYFPTQRTAIFVDGCFWHGCPLCGHLPKTRTRFWEAKITRNRQRDSRTKKILTMSGFTVLRVWEHQLKTPQGMTRAISTICRAVRIGRRGWRPRPK